MTHHADPPAHSRADKARARIAFPSGPRHRAGDARREAVGQFEAGLRVALDASEQLALGELLRPGATIATYASDAVLWEIAETRRQGNYMFGIQINRDNTHPVPKGLPSKNVIRWDFKQIVNWLATWV